MEQTNDELRKRMEREIKDIKLWNLEFIGKLDSKLIDFEKLMTTRIPDLSESQIQIIKEKNEPIITFEKVSDKLEFITINRPMSKKDILRIPSVSSNFEEPYITVENPYKKEETINIHRPKKKNSINQ